MGELETVRTSLNDVRRKEAGLKAELDAARAQTGPRGTDRNAAENAKPANIGSTESAQSQETSLRFDLVDAMSQLETIRADRDDALKKEASMALELETAQSKLRTSQKEQIELR